MVDLLFLHRPPTAACRVLDPGCGEGAFIEGVRRWCHKHRKALPRIVGVEADPGHIPALRQKFRAHREVTILHEDFLGGKSASYDYVVGNPPYVGITELSESEKTGKRCEHKAARAHLRVVDRARS